MTKRNSEAQNGAANAATGGRREVLKLMGTLAAAVAGQADLAAQPNASVGKRLDNWATLIRDQVASLPAAQRANLLKRNGVVDIDEFALTLAKRFPELDPTKLGRRKADTLRRLL